MFDHGLSVLEQYELSAKTVKRGRGALLCETEKGLIEIREYHGTEEKIRKTQEIQISCQKRGFPLVDVLMENKERKMISVGSEGNSYAVRRWYWGKECDARRKEDVKNSVVALARLHSVLKRAPEEDRKKEDLLELCKRHNRELRMTGKFLRKKRKKNPLEERLQGSIQRFVEQGECIVEKMEQSGYREWMREHPEELCHGSCNQHNILFTKEGIAIVNFERWQYETQTMDLCQFMRKILEKHAWNPKLGQELLQMYEGEKKLSDTEKEILILQLSYPWKYWKLANFYKNSNKVWIPQKTQEKLDQTIYLADAWEMCIKNLWQSFHF